MKRLSLMALLAALFITGCGDTATNTANTTNANTAPAAMTLAETEVPQRIRDMMAARGEQDQAQPDVEITAPEDGSVVESSTVRVEIELSGDLKGYMPGMDPETKMGNHVHVILDNQPYEAYYNIEADLFELRNVPDGEHTLRVFASRPWHESYKNEGSFDMVRFTVKNGGADVEKPATTNTGQQMSNVNSNTAAPGNANTANANAGPTPEGKDMPPSQGGKIDDKLPLLTYSRPKGEYKGADADPIMIDFWLIGGQLTGDGGQYRVRYSVNDGEAKYIDRWAPVWLSGWTAGKHSIKLELVDAGGNVVDNGGYNSTTREITVVK
ncbi:MAG TPA: hypothetical protein VK918_09880 [Pyrinomonadaceae bacterium]|nr:hypothetical protein [Pyrinomonadaceae bacterium]